MKNQYSVFRLVICSALLSFGACGGARAEVILDCVNQGTGQVYFAWTTGGGYLTGGTKVADGYQYSTAAIYHIPAGSYFFTHYSDATGNVYDEPVTFVDGSTYHYYWDGASLPIPVYSSGGSPPPTQKPLGPMGVAGLWLCFGVGIYLGNLLMSPLEV